MNELYLVTGGAGFIGSNIVERLLGEGARVRVLDNFSTGKQENIAHLKGSLEVIKGDLRNPQDVARAVEGADYVLHQGALPSVPKSVADPVTTNECNVTGTLNLLVACRDAKVRRVVFASSSSVYGDTPTLPKVEDMPPNPISPYALQKLTGEFYCRQFTELYGLETVSLRYFNVFGPRQDPGSQYAAVIPNFVSRSLEDLAPIVYGDGEQTRDFTYVDNVVQINLQACRSERVAGMVFNVATQTRQSLNEILRLLGEILERSLQPEYLDERAGDIKHSIADISAARMHLGYNPPVSFEQGLRHYVKWFSDHAVSSKG